MLDELVEWGELCNLSFNPDKTVAVGFTRARKYDFEINLTIHGQPVQYVNEVRYLGLFLDKRLNWTAHLEHKLKANKKYLHKMIKLAKTAWGLKPYIMRWTWTCIVWPNFIYASVIWQHSIKSKRTWHGESRSGNQRSHLRSLHHLVRDLGVHEIMLKQDDCNANNPADVTVCQDTFDDRIRYREYMESDDYPLWVFTDGSKLDEHVWCALRIRRQDEIYRETKFRISDRCSVYQAEVTAIQYESMKRLLCQFASSNVRVM